jgi:DNA gyrase/topoisomerase IV subunit A
MSSAPACPARARTLLSVTENGYGKRTPIGEYMTEQHTLHYHWVKGHAENAFNNRCDELAVAESHKF